MLCTWGIVDFIRVPIRKKERQAFQSEADHRKKPAHRHGADIFGMVKDLEVIFGKGPGG
jgi:hypothetical protein